MLEITLLRRESTAQNNGKPSVFQFENDELQAFLADAHATDAGCQVLNLRALGVPLTVTGDALKPAAKTAGPGAPRKPLVVEAAAPVSTVAVPSGTPRTQAPGINTPIQEQARESGTLRTPTTVTPAQLDPAKPDRSDPRRPVVPEKK